MIIGPTSANFVIHDEMQLYQVEITSKKHNNLNLDMRFKYYKLSQVNLQRYCKGFENSLTKLGFRLPKRSLRYLMYTFRITPS